MILYSPSHLRRHVCGLLALALAVLAPATPAQYPWRIPFAEIRADGDKLVFCGAEWCGYYANAIGGMLTVPRDSLKLPPVISPPLSAALFGRNFSFQGSTITESRVGLPDTNYFPGMPGIESLRYLADAAQSIGESMKSPVESISQIAASSSQIFVSLRLQDSESGATTSGIGWFDPGSGDYARIYSPALIGYYPEWIGCTGDTLHALFVDSRAGRRMDTKWIGFYNGQLSEIDWKSPGTPGSVILSMEIWKKDIAFATDSAIGIRYRDGEMKSWATDGVASRKPVQTYCAVRAEKSRTMTDIVAFQVLPPGRAGKVFAVYGDWVQIAVPNGVEAYVDSLVWVANAARVEKSHWQCEKPCFFTLRIPSQGSYLITELTDTPLTFIDFDRHGAKVGILSAWAKRSDLSPVLVPVK